MAQDLVKFSVEAGLARVELNRPDSGNGITEEMADQFLDAASRCETDGGVRAVLLTGAGKNFCVGGDLKVFRGAGSDVGRMLKRTTALLHAACAQFARMDAPVVAAIQGVAAGGGLSLALLGDLVYGGESAKFTMAYTAAGLSPDGGSTFLLPRLIGLRRAQELTLTNRRLTAEEAKAWGLITSVLPDDTLFETAEKQARALAQGPTRAFGRAKRLLLESFETPFETQMEREGTGIATSAGEPDAQEGMAAFAEKRAPTFTGHL